MKFFKIILFFLFCIVAYSCDIFSFAEIINKSDKEITIEILYNRSELEAQGLKSFQPYFENKNQVISFDTLSMIGKLKIDPNDSLLINRNRGSSPRFEFIKSLKVFADDTIVLTGQNEILKLFKETSPRVFTLEIK